jgi:hypothetical protein
MDKIAMVDYWKLFGVALEMFMGISQLWQPLHFF